MNSKTNLISLAVGSTGVIVEAESAGTMWGTYANIYVRFFGRSSRALMCGVTDHRQSIRHVR